MTNQLIPQPVLAPITQYVPTMIRDDDHGDVDLMANLDTLYDNRWLIVKITLMVSLLGLIFAFMAKPVYEANMLIHVEDERNNKDSKNILGDMASIFESKAAAASEMELLRSRLVVAHAVDNLKLYISAGPKYFPVAGAWIAGLSKQISNPGIFGYGGYVWGSEKIDVPLFDVPDALLDRDFVIRAEGNGKFQLSLNELNLAWKGEVGKTLNFDTESGDIVLRIEHLAANPGAEFMLKRNSRLITIENVQKVMNISEQGKESGVINVTLQGQDPVLVNRTLSEIGREYMHQNLARKTEEAQKSLSFLDEKLPKLKQQLQLSEEKYNQFRNINGTIDLSEEAKLSLQQLSAAKTRRLELQQMKTEYLTRFTENHPALAGINGQINDVTNEMKVVAGNIKRLPMLEQEILSLSRDIKVNTDLYTTLLTTAQQLRLITASKVSNVRLVDAPMMPEKAVKPNRPVIIALAVLLGLFFGVISAFIKKSLNRSIDDPDEIERKFGLPVYASIPHSEKLKALNNNVKSKDLSMPLLANLSSTDIAIESLRSFRTALQFSMSHSKNNIVLMTGATPGLGKTFVSANLAAIIATTGKRILLIDADLRNGHLHKYFGLDRQNGLSNVLTQEISLEKTIHRGVMGNMDFISAGNLPANPSELLLRPDCGELLQILSANYDLVLIDTTPILAVSDTLIIGAHAGAIYIVTRSGVTTAGQIQESIKRLSQAGLSAKGVILNDQKLRAGSYGYGYGYGYGVQPN